MSPWRRRPLTIPPDSLRAWVSLAVWEFWMGILVSGTLYLGARLILAARAQVAGPLNVLLNAWCGVLLISVAVWLVWELWSAVAPKPITDDFLKLLDDSFGRDWRSPRTWPWTRLAWAYGVTLTGAAWAVLIGVLVSAAIAPSRPVKTPTPHVETSQQFKLIQH